MKLTSIEDILTRSAKILKNPIIFKELNNDINYALEFCRNTLINNNTNYFQEAFIFVNATIDKIWENLNIGCWKDIPKHLREAYGYATFMKATLQLQMHTRKSAIYSECNISEIIITLDTGLILGNFFREFVCQCAHFLCSILWQECREFPYINPTYPFHQVLSTSHCVNEMKISQIQVEKSLAIFTFKQDFFNPRKPVKLTSCIDHWPALKKWADLKYITKKIGPRLVPIEVGSSYTSSDWSQKLVTVDEFIKHFILPESPKHIGYLAQHQLFDQIPELLDDIDIPDYCALADVTSEVHSMDINAWFGSSQTVSDLHYDPKHNFLVQVVGKKRILLVDPKWNSHLYPHKDHLLRNTAQVNPEKPDFIEFPKLKNVEIIECILNEGEMLYIPPKWWHHVRALSVSFSVSFWWE